MLLFQQCSNLMALSFFIYLFFNFLFFLFPFIFISWRLITLQYRSPAQVECMRQVLGPVALGRPRGIGWRGRLGEGIGMGNTCNSMTDSCQCMTKTTTISWFSFYPMEYLFFFFFVSASLFKKLRFLLVMHPVESLLGK